MRGFIEQGRSQGILVYNDGTPVGWCQFVAKDELRFTHADGSSAAWFVTCFVIDPRYRGLGATGVALPPRPSGQLADRIVMQRSV